MSRSDSIQKHEFGPSLFRDRAIVQAVMIASIASTTCCACGRMIGAGENHILHRDGRHYHADCHFRGPPSRSRPRT